MKDLFEQKEHWRILMLLTRSIELITSSPAKAGQTQSYGSPVHPENAVIIGVCLVAQSKIRKQVKRCTSNDHSCILRP